MSQWQFQPIVDSYVVVAMCALVLLLLLRLPTFKSLARGRKLALRILRGLVIALVMLAMLRPTYVSTSTRAQVSTLILMLDVSRSMSVPDAGGATRWQALRDSILSAVPQLSDLAQKMEVAIYMFDASARRLPFERGNLELTLTPEGNQSDIAASLNQVVRDATGKRLAGVILLSDGAQRALAPRVDIQSPARQLARLGYPLYTIPFGLPRDQTQSRDVTIENLPDQYTVFVKNEFEVKGILRVQGYANKEIPVNLTVVKPDGSRDVLGPIPLTPDVNDQQLDVRFTLTPDVPGQYKLTMQAAAQSGELVTDNNELDSFVTVREGGLRALYLYGSIVGGQRIDRDAIAVSPNIELDHRWIDSRARSQWPIDLQEELKDELYDVFVLGDLDSTALGDENCEMLANAVGDGKGLIMLGGYHSFGPGGYYETALADVLPVRMDRLERQAFDVAPRTGLHLDDPINVLPSGRHFITRLRPEGSDEQIWRELPPLLGANKFLGLSDNAEVLAQSQTGEPILVAGVYGRGRVLALAAESTSRWFRYGFKSEHQRFWRQVILWLARKEDSLGDGVWVRLDQRRFDLKAQVRFQCGVNLVDGVTGNDVTLTANVTKPDDTVTQVSLGKEGQTWTGAIDLTDMAGDYLIQVTATKEGEEIGSQQRTFAVIDRDLELSDPAANPRQLQQLASFTADAGGRSLPAEQLPQLLRQIKDAPEETEIEIQSKWQLADTATDAWLFFLLVVVLLCGEWFLRKKWKLV